MPSLPLIGRRTVDKDASIVFFIVSAIYAAPHMGETAGNIAAIVCLGIGWLYLLKEKNK